MKRFVSGLLVVALSMHPLMVDHTVQFYKSYCATPSNVEILKRNEREEIEEIVEMDFEPMFLNIDENGRYINWFLQLKNEIYKSIMNLLKFKSKNKVALNEEQVSAFQFFVKEYDCETELINEGLGRITELKLDDFKYEAIKGDAEPSKLLSTLQTIVMVQKETITRLKSLISTAEYTFATLSNELAY